MNDQTFKPDLSKTLKPSIGYYAYHNGSWGKNAASPDKDVWSCCMHEKKTGEVIIIKIYGELKCFKRDVLK